MSAIEVFTGVLAVSTIGLWIYTAIAARAAKKSANISFVASMPVLSPLIVPQHTSLHPLKPVNVFRSYVCFVFENFGRTPAVIREVRGDLFLNEGDTFPQVEFESLARINYEPIVAGDSRGEHALMGVAECMREFTLKEKEFRELLAEGKEERYRRFALVGQVVYDDFF